MSQRERESEGGREGEREREIERERESERQRERERERGRESEKMRERERERERDREGEAGREREREARHAKRLRRYSLATHTAVSDDSGTCHSPPEICTICTKMEADGFCSALTSAAVAAAAARTCTHQSYYA